ncbi:MAG: class II histone deacetylase [Proteobacteria bacterium]|nr:class II histone deacetylase [Pseudomonadota bacterium]
MANTAFYYDERCMWHSTGLHALVMPVGGWVQPPAAAGHAESPESKRRIKSLMDVSGLAARVDVRSAPSAGEDDLRRVHPDHYLRRFKQQSDAGGGDLGELAPFGRGSYEIAKLSTGLVMAAIDSVVGGRHRNAYAMSRPPGHHCLADLPMGFCLLANIAVAVEAARAKHGLERIAVIDWDVHHGNGTQAIFYERPDVLTISLHQDRCFPPGYSGTEERGAGRGAGYNYNIPLQPGGGDDAYRYAFERIVVPVLDRYRPQLLVVASGLDANAADPLARMQLHSESYRWMTQALMHVAASHCGGRLVAAHEGGYAEAVVPFCGHAVVEALAGETMGVEDPFLELFRAQQPSAEFQRFQRSLIDAMADGFELN